MKIKKVLGIILIIIIASLSISHFTVLGSYKKPVEVLPEEPEPS